MFVIIGLVGVTTALNRVLTRSIIAVVVAVVVVVVAAVVVVVVVIRMKRPAAAVVILVEIIVLGVFLALFGHFVQNEVDLMRREVKLTESFPQPFLIAHLQSITSHF